MLFEEMFLIVKIFRNNLTKLPGYCGSFLKHLPTAGKFSKISFTKCLENMGLSSKIGTSAFLRDVLNRQNFQKQSFTKLPRNCGSFLKDLSTGGTFYEPPY